ncbi:hypothetical protein BH11ACT5_BH11ACT5_10110 [soil metagenome]
MGTLNYADADNISVTMTDRQLAHIKFVMVNKLRRGEPFTFSWDKPEADGGGRASVWVSKEIPLTFEFDSTEPHEMNRQWLEQLSAAASTVSGLVLTEEPAQP